jgi:hypothetical protein
MQDMFIKPTLAQIQRRARRFRDVSYAQIGKTSVASLSGFTTRINSKAVNAFDVTPPLRLTELLQKAETLSQQVEGFLPKPPPVDGTTAVLNLGNIPVAKIIGLLGAYGEDRALFLELNSGVNYPR